MRGLETLQKQAFLLTLGSTSRPPPPNLPPQGGRSPAAFASPSPLKINVSGCRDLTWIDYSVVEINGQLGYEEVRRAQEAQACVACGGGQKADGGQAGPNVGRAQGGAGGEKDSRGSDGDLPFSGNRGMER